MTLTLSNASGARLGDSTATGTITNTDPMPKAWMARFGRTVGTQVVNVLSGDARKTPRAGESPLFGSGVNDEPPPPYSSVEKMRAAAPDRKRRYVREGNVRHLRMHRRRDARDQHGSEAPDHQRPGACQPPRQDHRGLARPGQRRPGLKRSCQAPCRVMRHGTHRGASPHAHWERFTRILVTYPLPQVRVVHSVYR